jgi:hypothetical protein
MTLFAKLFGIRLHRESMQQELLSMDRELTKEKRFFDEEDGSTFSYSRVLGVELVRVDDGSVRHPIEYTTDHEAQGDQGLPDLSATVYQPQALALSWYLGTGYLLL